VYKWKKSRAVLRDRTGSCGTTAVSKSGVSDHWPGTLTAGHDVTGDTAWWMEMLGNHVHAAIAVALLCGIRRAVYSWCCCRCRCSCKLLSSVARWQQRHDVVTTGLRRSGGRQHVLQTATKRGSYYQHNHHRRVTMTTESCKNGAMTLSPMNFSGYVRHVTSLNAYCLVVGLELWLGLYLMLVW